MLIVRNYTDVDINTTVHRAGDYASCAAGAAYLNVMLYYVRASTFVFIMPR